MCYIHTVDYFADLKNFKNENYNNVLKRLIKRKVEYK